MGDVGAQWTGVFLNESVLSGVLPLKRWGAVKAALSNWPCVIKPSLAYQPICSHQPYLIFSSENLSGICFFFFCFFLCKQFAVVFCVLFVVLLCSRLLL